MPPLDAAQPIDAGIIETAIDRATRALPPLWPLETSVAVNPFLGQSGESLAMAGARLARAAGAPVTPRREWYRARLDAGLITDADLHAAWQGAPAALRPATLATLRLAIAGDPAPPVALPTIADLAARASGIDWPGLVAERVGAWAAGYFDAGQALWAAPKEEDAYSAWRITATHDLTPELAGLTGFALHVTKAPDTATAAIARAVARLGIAPEALDSFFHRSLMTLGGWSQLARQRHWQAALEGRSDSTVTALLAIRLIWDEALFLRYGPSIADDWAVERTAHASPVIPTADLIVDALLQEAAERAYQRKLANLLASGPSAPPDGRPLLQAVFCIDVRSEVFRRALEAVDPRIQTLGFAGFFGMATAHRRFASEVVEHRLPVLLAPAVDSVAGDPRDADLEGRSRIKARAKRAWGRFKGAAVSSFAFVEATGPVHAGSLLIDALGLRRKPEPADPVPRLDPALTLATKVRMAESVLRAMSLTSGFAKIVLLAGHGATVANNPHASSLQCGACGGHAGDVNARLLASLLNDADVRSGLASRGIPIPDDTTFIGALHDTTTDDVTVFVDSPTDILAHALTEVRTWLDTAGVAARRERIQRMPRTRHERDVARRSRDWAETRPEWGLAGCKAFIAAPRSRTRGRAFNGSVFLHDYAWREDPGFGVLELILTAPVVVASWISLQYYGSTVAPDVFGAGNKLLHNVTGGIGVVEGNGGLLRTGLPWQSVHDGGDFIHEPLRLSVCVEAPVAALTDILRRHDGVRALFDNQWLHLLAMDDAGHLSWRYAGNLRWVPMDPEGSDANALPARVAV